MQLNYNRRQIISAVTGGLLVLWTLAAAGQASLGASLATSSSQGHNPSSKHMVVLHAEGKTLLGAILQLGREQGVPLGIECVDHSLVTKRIKTAIGPAPFGHVLDGILHEGDGLFRKEDHGVVLVTCRDVERQKANMLDLFLPRFSIPKCTMGEASHRLQMAIFAQQHPGVGVAGDFMPGESNSLIGPISLQTASVRAVLDRIVSLGPKGAWIVRVPPRYMGKIPDRGLWRITAYDDPTIYSIPDLVRSSILSYPAKRAAGK